ncbi:MAG: hypothetical protein K5876_03605 [Ruminiclostridium sp.]|nr:hypothetical protein [Ruminiclostridium sp.]
MSCYITNTATVRTSDGSIAVSWNWPTGCGCVRVVFVHRLGGRDVTKLTPDELSAVSDLCFPDEFQIAGGKYVYPIGPEDAGLLKFRVYCCTDPAHTEFGKCGETVHITGITLNISYKTAVKKCGKVYKKVTFSVNADCPVPAEVLVYRLTPSGAEYPVTRDIPAGASELPPVIIPAQSEASLRLAVGHEEEFLLKGN